MEYRNTKNGVVITVSCEINGEHWERVDAPKSPKKAEKPETPKEVKKVKK